MKRIFVLFLAIFLLTGCGAKPAEPETTVASTTVETTVPETTETVPEETTLSGYPEGVEVEIVPGLDTLPIPEEIDHYDEVPLYLLPSQEARGRDDYTPP